MTKGKAQDSSDNLTPEIIAGIPDSETEDVIWERILSKLQDLFSDTAQLLKAVAQWSPGLQMMFFTTVLDGEVGNGGFNQFFFNSPWEYTERALEGLKLIGASQHAQVLRRAMDIYLEEKGDSNLQALYAGDMEEFMESYKVSRLVECDPSWYGPGMEEKFSQLRIRFIQDHTDQFIGI
jgi:hypothetical protein